MEKLIFPESKLLLLASKLPPYERGILKELTLSRSEKLRRALVDYENDKDPKNFKLNILRAVVETAVDSAYVIWSRLFSEYTTEYAKVLSKSGYDRLLDSKMKTQSLVYGEIDFFSFATILEKAQPKRGEIFYDLGHGTGKAVIAAALLYGHAFKKCKGIELIEELCQVSNKVAQEFERERSPQQTVAVEMIRGDILQHDWSDGDIIFINSTCFDKSLVKKLGEAAGSLKPGTRILTLTKHLEGPGIEIVDKKQFVMSWGYATCYLHTKTDVEV